MSLQGAVSVKASRQVSRRIQAPDVTSAAKVHLCPPATQAYLCTGRLDVTEFIAYTPTSFLHTRTVAGAIVPKLRHRKEYRCEDWSPRRSPAAQLIHVSPPVSVPSRAPSAVHMTELPFRDF